ncbi:hypothetical protein GCM10010492_55450 [Saccharothrix mutabilis subsp. mutabilis]|uniref:Uncharacterized protein n=1 Tax=Saccharothrix mutabilis subsp. mutabilis TaxID=66855 RepID=A0ABP3E023_9PSEU
MDRAMIEPAGTPNEGQSVPPDRPGAQARGVGDPHYRGAVATTRVEEMCAFEALDGTKSVSIPVK